MLYNDYIFHILHVDTFVTLNIHPLFLNVMIVIKTLNTNITGNLYHFMN